MNKLMINLICALVPARGLRRLVRAALAGPGKTPYTWQMAGDERKLFARCVRRARCYLEFGSGGSTICALEKSRAQIVSVDSSPGWLDYMRDTYSQIRAG